MYQNVLVRTDMIKLARLDRPCRLTRVVAQKVLGRQTGQGCPRSRRTLFTPSIKDNDITRLDLFNEQIIRRLNAWHSDARTDVFGNLVAFIDRRTPPEGHRDGANHQSSHHLREYLATDVPGGGAGSRDHGIDRSIIIMERP